MTNAIESNVMEKPSKFMHKKADKSDHNSLKANSRQIEAFLAGLNNFHVVDKTKVEFIKKEIASGKYQILTDKIAEKMIIDIEMI